MCRAYGDYLAAKKYHEDAAMIYEKGEFWLEGVAAWEKSMNWRMCLSTAQKTKEMVPAEFRYATWLRVGIFCPLSTSVYRLSIHSIP